jgi:predicted TIM-barrel fold metal-dependent hydrolase
VDQGTVVPPHRATPYLLDEALRDMHAAGVHGAVLHPPSWDPASHAQAIEAARLYPDRFAILGRIPLDEPDKRGHDRDLAAAARASSGCATRSCSRT